MSLYDRTVAEIEDALYELGHRQNIAYGVSIAWKVATPSILTVYEFEEPKEKTKAPTLLDRFALRERELFDD